MGRGVEPYVRPNAGREATPKRKCPTCHEPFWTQVGLDEHVRRGDHSTFTRRWITGTYSPEVLPGMQERARSLAAVTNARRRRCDACGHVSNPAGIGTHQHYTGHVGWTELDPVAV